MTSLHTIARLGAPGALLHFPVNLPEHAHQHRRVLSGNMQPADQPTHLLLCRAGDHGVDVTALLERSSSILVTCSSSPEAADEILSGRTATALGSRQLIQTERHRLTQVHRKIAVDRRDMHQPVAVAEVVIRQPEFLRPEQQRHIRSRQPPQDEPRAGFQPPDGMLQLAMPDRCRPDYERAIHHCIRNRGKILSLRQQRRCVYRANAPRDTPHRRDSPRAAGETQSSPSPEPKRRCSAGFASPPSPPATARAN